MKFQNKSTKHKKKWIGVKHVFWRELVFGDFFPSTFSRKNWPSTNFWANSLARTNLRAFSMLNLSERFLVFQDKGRERKQPCEMMGDKDSKDKEFPDGSAVLGNNPENMSWKKLRSKFFREKKVGNYEGKICPRLFLCYPGNFFDQLLPYRGKGDVSMQNITFYFFSLLLPYFPCSLLISCPMSWGNPIFSH